MNATPANLSGVIVVVDDNQGLREGIAGLLENNELGCKCFATADSAYEWLADNHATVSACLIDFVLPDSVISGPGLIRRIRDEFSELTVLAYSGQDEDHIVDAIDAGADLYVKKPFQPQSLLHMVRTLARMNSLAVTRRERDHLQECLDAMDVEVVLLDPDGRVITVNQRVRRDGKAEEGNADEGGFLDLFSRSDELHALNHVQPQATFDQRMQAVQRGHRQLFVRTVPVLDSTGHVKYYVQTGTDVTRYGRAVDLVRDLVKWGDRHSPERICELVARRLRQSLGYARVRLYLKRNGHLHGVACAGMPDGFEIQKYELAHDDPHAVRAFHEQKPILIGRDDLRNDRFFKEFGKADVSYQLQVPASSAQSQICVITIDDKGAQQELGPEDEGLLTLVGAAVGDAVQCALNQANRERRISWYECFARVDEAIAAETSVLGVLAIIVEEMQQQLNAAGAVVMTRNDASDDLGVVAQSGSVRPNLEAVRHDGTHGVVGTCIDGKEQVILHDAHRDADFLECYRRVPSGTPWKEFLDDTQCLIVEPVFIGSKVIGVIFVQFNETTSISELDAGYVDDMARRVAITLSQLEENRRIEAAAMQEAKLSDLALLSTGFAHGIRNPLSGVSFGLQALLGELGSSRLPGKLLQNLSDDVSKMRQELRQAQEMVERLIDWGRPQDVERKLLSLDDLVESLMDIVRPDFDQNHIDLRFFKDTKPATVFASPISLRTALPDLLWNAKKAMPQGGRVDVTIRHIEDSACLSVRDTGIGMSEEEVERLFEFDPLRPLPPGGSGLGLYLARKAVNAVGGRICCKSEPGKGTTIGVWLLSKEGAMLPDEAWEQ
ncbi:MAG: ATP-binding protein [Planctomycetota bacterium]